jgi:hypothetical protein
MVVHACNPSTQETEAGGLWVPGQPKLHSKTLSQLSLSIYLYTHTHTHAHTHIVRKPLLSLAFIDREFRQEKEEKAVDSWHRGILRVLSSRPSRMLLSFQ